ncbi:MAG TPA: hypothetical protein VGM20_03205 [Gemmatimonadales bacterium]|jgi:hypothetical protein
MNEWVQLGLGAIGAGSGTAFGAWAAFRIERADKRAREHVARGEALRRCMFVLLARRTVLMNISRQHLSHFADHPLRHITLQPFFVAGDELPLELDALLFIFDSAEANLLNRLQVHSRRYRTILWAIEFRNRVHLEGQEIAAQLASATGETEGTAEQFRMLVGPHRWAQLKDLTDSIYESVTAAIEEIDSDYRAVEAVAVAMFPEVKLFKVRELAAQSIGDAV